jgi:membrane-associated phospholipid phosphatase
VNSFAQQYASMLGLPRTRGTTSKRAAIAQAAHDTLVAMFPSQAPSFAAALDAELATIGRGPAKTRGIALGKTVAAAVLATRAGDGAELAEPRMDLDYVPGLEPGVWRQDPVSRSPIAMGAYWGKVVPFTLPSASAFRLPPPPALGSPEYAAAFAEVKRLGGDGVTTPTERTAEQTLAGIYWAYDGTPSLCAPPRLYNQITTHIAALRRTSGLALARLLALVNVAMADAGIASWESKFHHAFWRPVTAIREADEGTGPSGAGDGNPATVGDPTFVPLGAPASNLAGPSFTPPFPAYPSGHATFGGALFQTLRRFYRTDAIRFTFVSDELNGVTRDDQGNVRPLVPRTFASLSQAEEENGQSRIYLGIHWSFDKTAGITQGRQIADHVFEHAFTPLR